MELKMAKIEESAFENQVVKSICGKHGKTPAQVLLRWSVQRGIQVIPKSTKNERLAENFAIDDFTLTEEDMEGISGLNQNKRFLDPANLYMNFFNKHIPIFQ